MPQYSAREISQCSRASIQCSPPINKTTGEKKINKICKKKIVFTTKVRHLTLKSPKKTSKYNQKKI